MSSISRKDFILTTFIPSHSLHSLTHHSRQSSSHPESISQTPRAHYFFSSQLSFFLKIRSSRRNLGLQREIIPEDDSQMRVKFILCNGSAAATTTQYAAAVNRFLKFVSTLNIDVNLLPATCPQIHHFILWCLTLTNSSV